MRTSRRGLRCCLFGYKGNTRASDSGTATVQSRFFVVIYCFISAYFLENMLTEMPIAGIKWRQDKLMYYVNQVIKFIFNGTIKFDSIGSGR